MSKIAPLCLSLLLLLLLLPASTLATCLSDDTTLIRWSTWTGKPTVEDADVTVGLEERVLLDVEPMQMGLLTVEGLLVVDPTVSMTLRATGINVYGEFVAGEEFLDCRLESTFEILLYGEPAPGINPNDIGTKSLGVQDGGKLSFHGQYRVITWAFLQATATQGSTQVRVEGVVDWSVGESVLVLSTDYERDDNAELFPSQHETRLITAVSFDGEDSIVSFNQPLQFEHYGEFWASPNGDDVIDMRGEVALLSRNAKFRGDVSGTSLEEKWGAHIMILNGGTAMIEGVEVSASGQFGELGRYPIHFHRAGNQENSYVKRNSIHHNFQRALTLHGCSHLLVKDNVAYDTFGHQYFIEDGDEYENIFDHNLGSHVRPHDELLTSDSEPSIFWITHPTNHFFRNVAVGGDFGFWYAMPEFPTGFATPLETDVLSVHNRNLPMGDFVGNKAHGQTNSGLFIDRGQVNDAGDTELSSYIPINLDKFLSTPDLTATEASSAFRSAYSLLNFGEPDAALVEGFTAFKVANIGAWARGRFVFFHNLAVADSGVGCSMPSEFNVVFDSVLVGETDNLGHHSHLPELGGRNRPYFFAPDTAIVGYRSYDAGGGDITSNIRFYDFEDFVFPESASGNFFDMSGRTRHAAAFGAQLGPNTLRPWNRFYSSQFSGVARTFHYYEFLVAYQGGNIRYLDTGEYDVATKGIVHVDADGSLTGTCGMNIVGSGAHLLYDDCVKQEGGGYAHYCPGGVHPAYRWFGLGEVSYDPAQQYPIQTTYDELSEYSLSIERAFDGATETLQPSYKFVNYDLGTVEVGSRWNTNVVVNQEYFFDTSRAESWKDYFAANIALRTGEFIIISVPYPPSSTFSIFDGEDKPFTEVASKSELVGNSYFFDVKGMLSIKLEGKLELWNTFQGTGVLQTISSVKVFGSCPSSCASDKPELLEPSLAPVAPFYKECDREHIYGPPSIQKEYVILDTSGLSATWLFPADSELTVREFQPEGLHVEILSFRGDILTSYSTSPVNITEYTHFEIEVKLGEGHSASSAGLLLYLYDLDEEAFGTSLISPWYCNYHEISSSDYITVRVPLSDIGLQTNAIQAFQVIQLQQIPVEFYVRRAAFVSYSSDMVVDTSQSHYPPTSIVPPLRSSYTGTEVLSDSAGTQSPVPSPPTHTPTTASTTDVSQSDASIATPLLAVALVVQFSLLF